MSLRNTGGRIGGFFFKAQDPKALAQYTDHLAVGPVPTDYGREPWQQTAGPTAFAALPATTKYFGAAEQRFMLNSRVRNLEAMVAQLRTGPAAALAVAVRRT